LVALSAMAPLRIAAAQTGAPATAGAPSAEVMARADAIFRDAIKLYKAKRYAEAEAGFLEAWKLNPTYDVAGNLGHTEARLGKHREAAEYLAFALRNFPLTGNADKRRAAQEKFDEVRKLVTSVKVQVSVPRAEVFVDGRLVGVAPLAGEVFVEPSAHTIEAKLAGYEDAKQSLQAEKGAVQTVMLTMTAASPLHPAPAPAGNRSGTNPPGEGSELGGGRSVPLGPTDGKSESRLSIGWVVAGGILAAGGIGAGIGLTAAANAKGSTAIELGSKVGGRSGCVGEPAAGVADACADVRSARTDQTTFSNAAVVTFIAGGALALGTVGLGVWASKSKVAPVVQAAPIVGARYGGVVVLGAW
jgi:hypothetical protein